MRRTGTVDWYDTVGGFGCITPDDGSSRCFVHYSAVVGCEVLREGARVEFDLTEEISGSPAAERVTLVTVSQPPE